MHFPFGIIFVIAQVLYLSYSLCTLDCTVFVSPGIHVSHVAIDVVYKHFFSGSRLSINCSKFEWL